MGNIESRLKHSFAVGAKMQRMVNENPHAYGIDAESAFMLGYLHDIGYHYVTDSYRHAEAGGNVLRRNNYGHWAEVQYHGIPNVGYKSKALDLLNYCDMTVGPNGEDMTMDERVADIESRYGVDSKTAEDSRILRELLKDFV